MRFTFVFRLQGTASDEPWVGKRKDDAYSFVYVSPGHVSVFTYELYCGLVFCMC